MNLWVCSRKVRNRMLFHAWAFPLVLSVCFSILKAQKDATDVRETEVDVFVMAMGGGKDWDGFLTQRMRVCKELWGRGYQSRVSLETEAQAPPAIRCGRIHSTGCHTRPTGIHRGPSKNKRAGQDGGVQ